MVSLSIVMAKSTLKWTLCIFLLGSCSGFKHHGEVEKAKEVEELHSWRYLTYADRESPNPDKAFFTGMQVWRDKIFINIPRLYDNIPITFGWIPRNGDLPTIDQPIRPFPDYTWQDGESDGQCRGFVSTFRSRIDRCDRIWTIDSGKINALGSTPVLNPRVPCPARLMVFDLVTGKHVKTITLPKEVVRNGSTITYVSIEMVPGGGCDDMFVYISDTLAAGLIVYDVHRNKFWRHEHQSFAPDPKLTAVPVNGEQLDMLDGLIGTTTATFLSERVLIYHPYASLTLYYTPLRFVNDPTVRELPVSVLMHQGSQGIPLATDSKNNVYMSTIAETAIYKWNPSAYGINPILEARDPERLQVLADFSFVGDEVWFSSNRLQGFLNNNYYNASTNLRIMRLREGHKLG